MGQAHVPPNISPGRLIPHGYEGPELLQENHPSRFKRNRATHHLYPISNNWAPLVTPITCVPAYIGFLLETMGNAKNIKLSIVTSNF